MAGKPEWVASTGCLQPVEHMKVLEVSGKEGIGSELEVVHTAADTVVVHGTVLALGFGTALRPPVQLAPGHKIELRERETNHLVPCHWKIIREKKLYVAQTSRWHIAEDGTFRIEVPTRVDRLISAECSSANTRLQVVVDNKLIVAEAYYDVLKKEPLPGPVMLHPGQRVELRDESRKRVPCTWLVFEMSEFTSPPPPIYKPQGVVGSSVIEAPTYHTAPTAQRDALRLMTPKPVEQKKRSPLAQRMQAIDLETPKCTCVFCEIERSGRCACDGAYDPDGCFLCNPTKHERPPCPRP